MVERVRPTGRALLAACVGLAVWGAPVAGQDAPGESGLTEASRHFVQMVRSRDADGMADAFAPTGVMILGDGTTLRGPTEIRAHWAARWGGATGVNPLREYPVGTVVAGSIVVEGGGFGPDEAGGPIADYARVWERDSEGAWKILVFKLTL